jgi:hypothetical protein
MKLEYISDGSTDAPLIRLYDFNADQVARLRTVFSQLAARAIQSFELHTADFVEPINDCRLTLTNDRRDRGLFETNEPLNFQCSLMPETWDNVDGLTEPFCQNDGHGYQWLNRTNIALLLSRDGLW